MASIDNPSTYAQSGKARPVWNVYDQMRTARLNVKCLAAEISKIERRSKTIEVILALSGAASIGAFSFLQTGVGKLAWTSFGILAMIIIAVKPVFPLTEKQRIGASPHY